MLKTCHFKLYYIFYTIILFKVIGKHLIKAILSTKQLLLVKDDLGGLLSL